MLRVLRLSLLGLLALVVITATAYVVGRAQCLPPGWWLAVFDDDGDDACVA